MRLACEAFKVSQTCYRYVAKNNTKNDEIADWLLRLTDNHRSWGFGLCFLYLRNVKGFGWNHKRVYRIYRELELNSAYQAAQAARTAGTAAADGAERGQPGLVDGFHARPTRGRPQHPAAERDR